MLNLPTYEKIRKTVGTTAIALKDYNVLWQSCVKVYPRIILEIGAFSGFSSVIFGWIAKYFGGRLYSIEQNPKREWTDNIAHFELEKNAFMVIGKSEYVDTAMVPIPVDYLFIDGNHFLINVLQDYYKWSPLVRIGGRIAFHDIDGPDPDRVKEAVQIIASVDKTLIEIMRTPKEDKQGTIVFEKTDDHSP